MLDVELRDLIIFFFQISLISSKKDISVALDLAVLDFFCSLFFLIVK